MRIPEKVIIERIKNNNPHLEIIECTPHKDKYKDGTITVRCLTCGVISTTGTQWLAKKKNKTNTCFYCSYNQRKKTHTKFFEEFSKNNPHAIILLEEYADSRKKIKVKCGVCEYIWKTLPHNLTNGTGCPKCKDKKNAKKHTKTNAQFLLDMKEIRPDVTPLEEYTHNKTKILCRCNKCNFEWKIMPTSLLINKNQCPNCSSRSRGEDRIKKFLEDGNINFEMQKKFEGCIYKNSLRFDFYLPVYNLCIEFDGSIHYYPNNMFNIKEAKRDNITVEEVYNTKKIRDLIKDDYCKNNNIGLLRIPYTELKNIENILTETLNKILPFNTEILEEKVN